MLPFTEGRQTHWERTKEKGQDTGSKLKEKNSRVERIRPPGPEVECISSTRIHHVHGQQVTSGSRPLETQKPTGVHTVGCQNGCQIPGCQNG
jgi:hypothetical protein